MTRTSSVLSFSSVGTSVCDRTPALYPRAIAVEYCGDGFTESVDIDELLGNPEPSLWPGGTAAQEVPAPQS
ncbi:hypothetical protein BaRGS_00026568 [Batillaria attramentaria]|uniref:Uncharacterized protein n=1 Tax=Batillaria attramentaria TaxID=370345 RepID=A0ABD0K548_9CAEN